MRPEYSKGELISAIILFVVTMLLLGYLMFSETPHDTQVPMGSTGVPYMDIRSGSAADQSNGVENAR